MYAEVDGGGVASLVLVEDLEDVYLDAADDQTTLCAPANDPAAAAALAPRGMKTGSDFSPLLAVLRSLCYTVESWIRITCTLMQNTIANVLNPTTE